MTVPYKKIPELEIVFQKHPWLLDHTFPDEEANDKLGDASFHYLLKYRKELEMEMIHPLIRKHVFNAVYVKACVEIDRYRKVREADCDDYAQDDADDNYDGDGGYSSENIFSNKQMQHAMNLSTLPEKYLNKEDIAFIHEMAIRKLTT